MRVAHVITRLIVGGAQENTVASVLGLREKPGVEVSLVSGPTTGPEGSLEPMLRARGQAVRLVPDLVRPVSPLRDFRAYLALKNYFRETRPDLAHTHSGKAGVLGRWAARSAGVRTIVHTIHGPSFGNFQSSAANAFFRAAERSAARATTHFVSVAQAMTDQYLAAGIARPEDYTRIFSGFDLAPFAAAGDSASAETRKRWGIRPNETVVGKIARLFKLKGHGDLFAVAPELVRRCPTIRFLLVGDGIWRRPFEERVREMGLADRFVFTGLVPPERVPELVGAMDILVHLSRREGLPRALPQAMAAGRPVVAYDCDGAREVCLNEITGFLAPAGDLSTLAESVVRLAQDPELRLRMGVRGRETARALFSVEKMVDELHGLYLRLISS